MGKRFGAITKSTNKCLLKVEKNSLISLIIDRFKESGIPHKDVCLITGYQSELLKREVSSVVHTVYNPFFSVSGILGSFWAAKPFLAGKRFIFTTSDHYFDSKVLSDCMKTGADIRVVVQKKSMYTKEDAKVIIQGLKVIRMGKNLPVTESDGEFGGMVLFSAKASGLFFEELESHFQKNGLGGYMMELLMKVSQKYKMPVRFSECDENARIEIDSVHDLVQARKMACQ